MTTTPFRLQVLALLKEAFGEPRELKVERDSLYRWVLERQRSLSIYVTLDSPELPDMAHLMISDPRSSQVNPIASVMMHTMAEAHAVIERIKAQWHEGLDAGHGAGAAGAKAPAMHDGQRTSAGGSAKETRGEGER